MDRAADPIIETYEAQAIMAAWYQIGRFHASGVWLWLGLRRGRIGGIGT
jgi:hypothetical protein